VVWSIVASAAASTMPITKPWSSMGASSFGDIMNKGIAKRLRTTQTV